MSFRIQLSEDGPERMPTQLSCEGGKREFRFADPFEGHGFGVTLAPSTCKQMPVPLNPPEARPFGPGGKSNPNAAWLSWWLPAIPLAF